MKLKLLKWDSVIHSAEQYLFFASLALTVGRPFETTKAVRPKRNIPDFITRAHGHYLLSRKLGRFEIGIGITDLCDYVLSFNSKNVLRTRDVTTLLVVLVLN